MKVIVFGKTVNSAKNKLDEIVNSIPRDDIKQIKKHIHNYVVELFDGTRYMVVPATQSARGHKCDKVYVEYGVDQEIIDCVIYPILNMSKLDIKEQIEWF